MKISEVSKKYDISIDTLRYYEKAGLLPNIKKNSSGIREYTDMDCERVEFIKCMRSAGMPVERLSKYIALCEQGEETAEERRSMLIQQRTELIEKRDTIQRSIDKLDYKINIYYNTLRAKENCLHKTK